MFKALKASFLVFLLLTPSGARAKTALDLTAACDISVTYKTWAAPRMLDRDYVSSWKGTAGDATVEVHSPDPCFGLYLCFSEKPAAWRVQTLQSGHWETVCEVPASEFAHQYCPLDGLSHFRIAPQARAPLGITELFVLGEGEIPPWVQRWESPSDKADLLLLFAHPDDEVLFFGGTIPTYAGEQKRDLVAAVLSCPSYIRRSELLNSLWTCGLRSYPVIGTFSDRHSLKLETAYRHFSKSKIDAFIMGLLREYRPKVMVTHDIHGEYGHGMHRICADAALRCVPLAADPTKHERSAAAFGPWQVQKLYLHLYPENPIVMDWDQPLAAFDGRTGFEVAQEGYQAHRSQHRYAQFSVEPRDSATSSYHFGLAYSTVGPDIAANDFFEHLDP